MKHFPRGLAGLLVAAFVLGVAGDLLLRVGPPGINLTIWTTAVLGFVLGLAPRAGILRDPIDRVPLFAALGFAVLFSWREAEPLKLLVAAAIAASVALTAAAAIGRTLRRAYVRDYVQYGIDFGKSAAFTPAVVFGRTRDAARDRGPSMSNRLLAVLRGLLIAVPMLIVFGLLFVSADALFEQVVTDVFDFRRIASHAVLSMFFAWAAAATWWVCLEGGARPPVLPRDPDRGFPLGAIEVNVALGLVAALFVAFLATQSRYFFGGHEHVLAAAGLTYADYARRGFFELAWVAGIALAILVYCAGVLSTAGNFGKRAYKIVSAVLVVCVLLIIASSLHRMNLYVESYGLTRLRLYTALFMGWMAVVFLWLYFTILRERVRSFAWGFLLSGYAATFLVLAINPDALIVKTNLERAAAGKPLDMEYLRMLSADAVPTAAAYPSLAGSAQRRLKPWLADMKRDLDERPLRTWTIGYQRARSVLAEEVSDSSSRD